MKDEFNELFDDLVGDVVDGMKKYSDVVADLEQLLELEKENLVIKKKVATFSLDYDDNLMVRVNFVSKHKECPKKVTVLLESIETWEHF